MSTCARRLPEPLSRDQGRVVHNSVQRCIGQCTLPNNRSMVTAAKATVKAELQTSLRCHGRATAQRYVYQESRPMWCACSVGIGSGAHAHESCQAGVSIASSDVRCRAPEWVGKCCDHRCEGGRCERPLCYRHNHPVRRHTRPVVKAVVSAL